MLCVLSSVSDLLPLALKLVGTRRGSVRSSIRAAAPIVTALALVAAACGAPRSDFGKDPSWQQEFGISECKLTPTGRNQYFILEPGFQLVLEGGSEKVAITVLDETKTITGVVDESNTATTITTRVVEEREWKDDELVEVSRNFFAICPTTKDVFYFGEEVDDYKDGEVVSHGGAWLAGENGAKAGLVMPGHPMVGMRYYQEIAVGVALDRAEIVSLDETLETPAGSFSNCLKTQEGTALNPSEKEFKTYAPGIGLAQEESLLLTEYGFTGKR
jgi:hypothetical protein